MKHRILIVEDDPTLQRVLRGNLKFEGFDVEVASSGRLAMDALRTFGPHLVVLDAMLPDADGFDLCPRFQQAGAAVIMLTARSEKADKLRGLTAGAEDYVTKPFDFDELLARIHVVLRRTRPAVKAIVLGDVVVDFEAWRATKGLTPLELSHRELTLLRYLAVRHGDVVSRDDLLKHVWAFPEAPLTRLVDHAVARLRKKIEPEPHRPRFLKSAHGEGYCLTPTRIER
jgi:DNA-binding response OmpR family regulator